MTFDAKTLAVMAALQGESSMKDLELLMQEAGPVSDKTKAIMQLFSSQQAIEDDPAEAVDDFENSFELERQGEKRSLLHRARRTIESLERQLEDAYQIIDEFSAALGACGQCLGEDDRCPDCLGHGQPGWKVPSDSDYELLIKPAVSRYLQAQQERPQSPDSNN